MNKLMCNLLFSDNNFNTKNYCNYYRRLMMLYFIQTTHFVSIDYKKYGFKVIDNDTILLEKDRSIWKSIKLYDLGWGRENGFYRTPMLSKEELFFMVFPNEIKNDFEEKFNYWGSISIMLDQYCDFLLEQISKELRVNRDFAKKYVDALLYINSELNVPDNLIDRLSDKKLASNCKKWKRLNEEFEIIK